MPPMPKRKKTHGKSVFLQTKSKHNLLFVNCTDKKAFPDSLESVSPAKGELSPDSTLSLKRNAPWIYWLPLWPRVKVKWPRPGHIGKKKYTAKFIYLHSSQKEMKLSTVRFFRDWVYSTQNCKMVISFQCSGQTRQDFLDNLQAITLGVTDMHWAASRFSWQVTFHKQPSWNQWPPRLGTHIRYCWS